MALRDWMIDGPRSGFVWKYVEGILLFAAGDGQPGSRPPTPLDFRTGSYRVGLRVKCDNVQRSVG